MAIPDDGRGVVDVGVILGVLDREVDAIDVVDDDRGGDDRRGLCGQAEMREGPAHDRGIGEEREDLSPSAASGTPEDVDEEDAGEELSPGAEPRRSRCPAYRPMQPRPGWFGRFAGHGQKYRRRRSYRL